MVAGGEGREGEGHGRLSRDLERGFKDESDESDEEQDAVTRGRLPGR